MSSRIQQLYASDFTIGQRFSGTPMKLGDQEFRSFSILTGDDHPIHYNAEYASKTRFGRQVAHGLLVSSMTALGATQMSGSIEDSMIAFVEQGFKFIKAALLNDMVTSHFTIASIDKKENKNMALVTFDINVTNQNNEVLAVGFHRYLFKLYKSHE